MVCKRVKREHMPRDEYGNIADFVVDPMSTGARMNPSRKYDKLFGSRDFGKRIKDYFTQKYNTTINDIINRKLIQRDNDTQDVHILKTCY